MEQPSQITLVIGQLNAQLQLRMGKLTEYTHGHNLGHFPRDDLGKRVRVAEIINNGLCHVYALMVRVRLDELGVTGVDMVGSPTHVFLRYQGRYYDAGHRTGVSDLTRITRYPEADLIDYSNLVRMRQEFYNLDEVHALFSTLRLPDWVRVHKTVGLMLADSLNLTTTSE